MIANGCPQPRVGAVDFIAGHPRGRYVCLDRAVDQRRGKPRLGGKAPVLLRDSRLIAAIGILGPRLGQVERAVDQGVPTWGGIGQINRALGVLDAARGARVLALDSHAVVALLHVAGLVDLCRPRNYADAQVGVGVKEQVVAS